MALSIQKNSSGSGNYELPPKGSFAARLVDVWDEGEREDKFNPGQRKHEFRLTYLLDAPMSDGRPFALSEWVRVSLFKNDGKMSNLVARTEALSGRDLEEYDVTRFENEMELMESLIDMGALVTVGFGKTGKARVTSVVSLPRGLKPPAGAFKRKRDRGDQDAMPASDKRMLPGEPDWLNEAIQFGQFKGKPWREMMLGSYQGRRHKWCIWVTQQPASNPDQAETQARCGYVVKQYEARNAPEGDDASAPF